MLLRDGYNCYLLDSEDIYSWVRKIKYVINNYDKTKKIRMNAFLTSKILMLKKSKKNINILFKNLNKKNQNTKLYF